MFFFPSKEWPLALRLCFWTKPLSDEDSFKMMLFLIGNGLTPRLAAEWVMLSQFWTRDHEKMKKQARRADFVLTNLESKRKWLVLLWCHPLTLGVSPWRFQVMRDGFRSRRRWWRKWKKKEKLQNSSQKNPAPLGPTKSHKSNDQQRETDCKKCF